MFSFKQGPRMPTSRSEFQHQPGKPGVSLTKCSPFSLEPGRFSHILLCRTSQRGHGGARSGPLRRPPTLRRWPRGRFSAVLAFYDAWRVTKRFGPPRRAGLTSGLFLPEDGACQPSFSDPAAVSSSVPPGSSIGLSCYLYFIPPSSTTGGRFRL